MVNHMTSVPSLVLGSASKARHSVKLQQAFIKQALKYSEDRQVKFSIV